MNDKWLLEFFKAFRLCVTTLRIYPINNSSAINALDTVENLLDEHLSKNDSLTFTELSGRAGVVGFENVSQDAKSLSEELGKNFARCRVSSVTIKKGYTREELVYIVQNLSKYFREDWQADALARGFGHLGFNQVKYVAVTDEQAVVDKISSLVGEAGSDVAGILSLLKEVYDDMDGLSAASRPSVTTKLALELSKQEPEVLREIFERELPPKIEASGIKEKLLAALTKDKITEVYQQITKWYGDIKSSGISDFEAVAQLDRLKKFLAKMLECSASRELPFKLYEDLFNLGLIENIPDWAGGKSLPDNLVEQLEILKNIGAEELVSSVWAEKLPELTEKLVSAQMREDIIKLILKITANHKNPDVAVRQKAASALAASIKVLKARGYENLLSVSEHLFAEWLESESSREVYEALADILFDRIVNRILNSEFEHAQNHYELFGKLASELNRDENKRTYLAGFILRRTPKIVPILLNDVKSADEVRKKEAFEFLSKIGDGALDPLVKIIKEVADAHIRMLAAGILKNMGSPAIVRIKEELNLGLTKDEIHRFLEVLKFVGDGSFFDEVRQLMRYPDRDIKQEILRYASHIDMADVDKFLMESFKDEEVARMAVKLAAARRSAEVIPSLIQLMTSARDWELKEEIAIAMGEMADKKFEKPVIEMLSSSRGIFRAMSIEQERARLRAAYVLRRFGGSQEVLKALKKAARDKSHAVAVTAAESLKILESAPAILSKQGTNT
ncbi:MAG: HEAT repeat domain-containing protein [Endomicrobiia bacterium]|nr:HEAT repeat domain-containing protein [Endomicrobiia bacterium]